MCQSQSHNETHFTVLREQKVSPLVALALGAFLKDQIGNKKKLKPELRIKVEIMQKHDVHPRNILVCVEINLHIQTLSHILNYL